MDTSFQETLELVLKASNEGVWDWIVGEDEIYYSDRIYEFIGYQEGSAPNFLTEPERLLVKQDVAYLRNVLDLVIMDEEEELLGIDCKILRPDGRRRWVRIRGVVVRENGKAIRIAGSMIDITKRKRAEAALEEERSMLRLVIDHVPVQVYFKDCDSKFVLCNERQAQWLGAKSAAELMGKTDADYFAPEYAQAARADELRIMQTGVPIIGDIQKELWQHKEPTYVQTVKHPWYDSRGLLLGTFGISTDVTKLYIAQTKLEKVAVDLQRRNRNYFEELLLAREVQHSLLSDLEDMEHDALSFQGRKVELGQRYIPVMELAGDYFDVLQLGDNQLGLLICDVEGRGVRSALIVSMLRGLMEQSSKYAKNPEKYLSHLNRGLSTLLGKIGVNISVSACYAVMNLDEGSLVVASAGNAHPVVLNMQGKNMALPTSDKGEALGGGGDGRYVINRYSLEDVKACLFFTDGIYRLVDRCGEAWGVERLSQCFSMSSGSNLEEMLDDIVETSRQWSGDLGFDDDVCLLGVRLG